MKPCEVCQHPTTNTFGTDDEATRYPVCEDCYRSGRHKKWYNDTLDQWRKSGLAFQTSGNFATDRRTLMDHLKQNARITDGVCPNGCARLVDDKGVKKCPVCGFEYYQSSL